MTKKLLIDFFRNKANGIDTDVKDFEKYFDLVCYEYHKNIGMLINDLDECEDEYDKVEIIKKLQNRAMDEVIILQNLVEFLVESNRKKNDRIEALLSSKQTVYIEEII